jgi:hypothetical protein
MGIFADWIYKIKEWFHNLNERNSLITDFNSSARSAFISGLAPTFLKAQSSRGDKSFSHQYSQFNSGFRILVMGGKNLTREELIEVGRVILSNNPLVRNLIINGFDTLEINGENDTFGSKWKLKDYLLLT